jgi:hypothetical protein
MSLRGEEMSMIRNVIAAVIERLVVVVPDVLPFRVQDALKR